MFAERLRARTRPGGLAITGSVVLHLVLVVAVAVSAIEKGSDTIEYKVYRVDLYSPPPQELGEPAPPKPQPAIVRPNPPKPTTEVKERAPAPKPQPKKPVSTGTGKSEVAKG